MPNNLSEYHQYHHTDSSIQTLNELISGATNPISIMRGIELGILLRYEDEQGITNLEKIWAKYPLLLRTLENKNKFDQNLAYLKGFSGSIDEKIEEPTDGYLTNIYVNTILSVPFIKLNRDILIGEGNQIIDTEFEAFVGEKLKELQEDTKYYPTSKINLGSKGNLKVTFPNMTVWLWCRSLTTVPFKEKSLSFFDYIENNKGKRVKDDDSTALEGRIIDLTPFVDALNISVTPQGGTFGLTLPPIVGQFDSELGWQIKKGSLSTFMKNGELNYVSQGGYEDAQGNLNSFYFNNIIGENDVIFIRFETLNNEIKQRIRDKQYSNPNTDFEVPKSELAGKIYDMIGLVDTNSISHDPKDNNVQINIQGRDLMKLLIEDSSFFTPLNFIPSGSYFSSEPDDRLLNRIEGKLHTLTQVSEKTIEFSLKYLINALSNMGIVPDDEDGDNGLFTSYAKKLVGGEISVLKEGEEEPKPEFIDERSYQFKLDIESKKKKQERAKSIVDVIRKIKEKIGRVREEEKIADPKSEDGISTTFRTLVDFIKTGYDEKALNPKESKEKITGWDSFTFKGKVIKNYIPTLFHYYFVTRKKYWTDENGKKITLADKEKILNDWNDIAKELGYGILLCTDVSDNIAEVKTLDKNGWKHIYNFRNPRTSNKINISIKELN